MEEVTKVLPAIALRGTTILPDMIVHFDISRPKSVRAVEEAMLGDQKIFLITQKDPDTEVPGLLDVYKIGTIAVIKQVVRMPKDVLRILVEAERRAELLNFEEEESEYLRAEVALFGRNAVFRYRTGGNAAQLKRAVCRLLRADAESQQGTGRPDPRNRRSWKAGGPDLHESAPRLRKPPETAGGCGAFRAV
mgnify:CR=1 FL=1